MARRRPRAQKPVEEEEPVQEEPQDQQEEAESEPEEAEETAGARDDEGLRVLQFNDELSWRPAKPIPTATLLTRLEKLSKELSELEQEATNLESLKDVASDLGHRNLMKHKDRGVKAFTACCLVDLLELFAPEAPFTEDQLKVRAARPFDRNSTMLMRQYR